MGNYIKMLLMIFGLIFPPASIAQTKPITFGERCIQILVGTLNNVADLSVGLPLEIIGRMGPNRIRFDHYFHSLAPIYAIEGQLLYAAASSQKEVIVSHDSLVILKGKVRALTVVDGRPSFLLDDGSTYTASRSGIKVLFLDREFQDRMMSDIYLNARLKASQSTGGF